MAFKSISGYEGLYLINDKGEVYSEEREVDNGRGVFIKPMHKLSPGLRGRNGLKYEFVILRKNNKSNHHSVHRLVAENFLDNPNGFDTVNHKDHNTLNNNVSNLEWCNQQYNNEYSHNKKIVQFENGEKIAEYKSISFASKLTGISRTAINNALSGWSNTAGGYNWKYMKEE